MNRRGFLRAIAGMGIAATLPTDAFAYSQKFNLLQCFVRGFRFYEGDELLEEMREGDELQLVREPHNTYDHNAIALHYAHHKIGFIPRESNDVLSKLIDCQAVTIKAEIIRVEPDADPWERVQIAVYLVKGG